MSEIKKYGPVDPNALPQTVELYEKLKDKVENLFPLSLQKLYYHLNS